ncbi:MAG: Ig-like domain-containing protein [Chloroflexota bacterium]
MLRVQHRHRSFPVVVGFLLLSLLFTMLPGAEYSLTSVAYAQSCNAGLSGFLEQDTTLSNDAYITGNVTVRGNATLTIEPGTRVIMCGAYTLAIGALFNPGRLVAVGTPDQPIRIEAANPNTKWNSLFFAWGETEASMLRHVILTDGGGNDPNDANAAALFISDVRAIDGPIFEHVTVEDSGSNGVNIGVREEGDPSAPIFSNLTVKDSARAPITTDAAGVSGLSSDTTFTGNAIQRIQVQGDNLDGGMFFDQYWRKHDIPYELLGSVYIRENYDAREFSTWTIEPGVTILVNPFKSITIGSLFGDAQLIAEGTAEEPITIKPLQAGGDPWGGINFDPFSVVDSVLRHVKLQNGGGNVDDRSAVISKSGSGQLTLDHVEISGSANGALSSGDGNVRISNSLIENNRIGIELSSTQGIVSSSRIQNNAEGGLINYSNREPRYCTNAVGNYWGAANGPADTTNENGCDRAATNNGSGNAVSDNVLYRPWRTTPDGSGLENASSIVPDEFWVVADGVDRTELIVTVRDAQGNPLSGKQVALETTLGTLVQPSRPTNANGVTRASISSDQTGDAIITGRNVTDNQPLATISSVFFWQGGADTGGLVATSNAPYVTPELRVDSPPYQQGVPLVFNFPMRNTNPQPVDVTVTYAATRLNIGSRFTPVATVSKTLQPGESWDAAANWTPSLTGHQCVQVEVEYQFAGLSLNQSGGSFSRQRNLDFSPPDDPCKKPDANKLIPRSGGLKGVNKHTKNLNKQANLVDRCIFSIGFLLTNSMTPAQSRDYQTVATRPDFTPQTLPVGGDVTQAQADASNALAATAADIAELKTVLSLTSQRIQWAGQADDTAAVQRQLAAYRGFKQQYREAQSQMVGQIDTLLQVTEGAGVPNTIFTIADYEAHLAELRANGYDADTIAFLKGSGLNDMEVETVRQQEIAALEEGSFANTSFYEILRALREEAREEARSPVVSTTAGGVSLAQAELSIDAEPVTMEFEVGNPTESRATVNLQVRPVSLPLGWSYELDTTSVELDAGATTNATITLIPDGTLTEGVEPQVAVEGYIGSEFVGGILFEGGIPSTTSPGGDGTIYLPLIVR